MIETHLINPKKLKAEMKAFKKMLEKAWFSENEALRLFRKSKNLIATFGNFNTAINNPDLVGSEIGIDGLVRCDFVVGDSNTRHFVLVEFEDAKKNSIFKSATKKRNIPDWSPRFEHGFSQLVDWAWIMADSKNSISKKAAFKGDVADWTLLLISGRDSSLNNLSKERIYWRSKNANCYNQKVFHLTFDELYKTIVAKCLQSPYLK